MRDEDVSQLRERKFGFDKLEAHAVASIDHVGDIVEHDEIGGGTRGKSGADRRTAARSQRHKTVRPEVRGRLR